MVTGRSVNIWINVFIPLVLQKVNQNNQSHKFQFYMDKKTNLCEKGLWLQALRMVG